MKKLRDDPKVGDMIFTNFFGEIPLVGIIKEVNRGLFGIHSILTILGNGKMITLLPTDVLMECDL
jgi:hypothetical protein